ncbi:MAG TPA: phospho-N-acetylmuramoyl-pentapeptide-transferase [Firmicutes bacterium]|nr:phospho-N-acetylmuramoyl-pentapeptide-transferase [Bacillota bacterium]
MNSFFYVPLVSLALSLLMAPLLIPYLRRLKVGQQIRSDGPQRHMLKAGTPTMGGLIFIPAALATTLFFIQPSPYLWVAILAIGGFGILGFWDDYLKVVRQRSLGLRARSKLLGQLGLSLLVAWLALRLHGDGLLLIPFTSWAFDLGILYIPFAMLVMIGAANAVNLTDGLDGLASGTCAAAFAAYFLLAWKMGQPDLAVLALAMVGALAGFLRFNYHPAQIFMGDSGSMALGAGLGAMAVLTRHEVILLLVGLVFVLEACSVILQVAFFRFTGRRLFRMSPLHHHFELIGFGETQVVWGFWLLGIAGGMLGLIGAFWPW